MIPLRLAEIAEIVGGRIHGAGADPSAAEAALGGTLGDVVVTGPVVTDSREAAPGALYVARVGESADGHDFAGSAAAAGAVAALTTRPVPELPSVVVADVQEAFAALAAGVVARVPGLVVIGITGSSGKTTTKDLLASVLVGHGETVANVGSLNSEVGVPLTVCRVTPTTRYLVLEMGARGVGHIDYLARMTHPHIGVVLNVGSAHVGEFGSQDVIARAKAELVQALPPGGLAVLNADDPRVAAMPVAPGADLARTGCRVDARQAQADRLRLWAEDVVVGDDGAASFSLCTQAGERAPVALTLLGEHQVGNALAVAAVASHLGMAVDDIARELSSARPGSRWRMERHMRDDGVTIVNDAYNANPESTASALRTLVRMGGARRTWAVLGEMLELGPQTPQLHREVGELARDLGVTEVLAVGAGAREVAAGASDDVGESAQGQRARWVADTDEAFSLLSSELRRGDVVLLKSSRDAGLRILGDRLTTSEVTS